MAISDEVWDQVREAWAASIPEQYRHRTKPRGHNINAPARLWTAAIILAPPEDGTLDRWIEAISTPHVTVDQARQMANHENAGRDWGKHGKRKSKMGVDVLAEYIADEICRLSPSPQEEVTC